MHTCSWINYKLSVTRLSSFIHALTVSMKWDTEFSASTWENPLLCKWEECSPVLLFELAKKNWQDPKPCFGHIAGVVQSLRGTDPRILERRHFADEERLVFPNDGPFFSRILAWLGESNFSNFVQDFLHRVSPKLFCSLRNECIRVLRYTTQLWYAFHISSFWAFLIGCSSTLQCGNRHLSPALQPVPLL